MVFDSYVRETVNRHRQFKMEPSLWTVCSLPNDSVINSLLRLSGQFGLASWKQRWSWQTNKRMPGSSWAKSLPWWPTSICSILASSRWPTWRKWWRNWKWIDAMTDDYWMKWIWLWWRYIILNNPKSNKFCFSQSYTWLRLWKAFKCADIHASHNASVKTTCSTDTTCPYI